MTTLAARLTALLRDERGATVIEYTFIAAFISLAIIAGATQVGLSVKGFFESVSKGFN
jgi:pilus assembly protein Flp/PilA